MNIDEQWIETGRTARARATRCSMWHEGGCDNAGRCECANEAEPIISAVVPLVVAAARQEREAELEPVGGGATMMDEDGVPPSSPFDEMRAENEALRARVAELEAGIDTEIARLQDGQPQRDHTKTPWWEFRGRAWLDGVGVARAVVADNLRALLAERGGT